MRTVNFCVMFIFSCHILIDYHNGTKSGFTVDQGTIKQNGDASENSHVFLCERVILFFSFFFENIKQVSKASI